jgi:hypothetical protein
MTDLTSRYNQKDELNKSEKSSNLQFGHNTFLLLVGDPGTCTVKLFMQIIIPYNSLFLCVYN